MSSPVDMHNTTAPATNGAIDDTPPGGFRQSMAWLHTWAGLTLGWVLFFIFLTGSAGYFDTEIDRWMKPELPVAQTDANTAQVAQLMLQRLNSAAPDAERWFLGLPTSRLQPYPSIFWNGASATETRTANGNELLDATTGLPFAARDTGGGQLLYRMHWRLHYLPTTLVDVIVGFAALFMLIALISGIIIHKKIFKDFFTFRPTKGQRSWLDAHNVVSVLALPFHVMITYSGLIFMGLTYMPLIVAAHYGADADGRQQFISDIFDAPGLIEPAHQPAPLVSLDSLITTAETRWGEGRIRSIDIQHPGDKHARIIVSETTENGVGSSGERLVFDGVKGELLEVVAPAASVAKGTRDLFVGLHEGQFAPPVLRWLYFLSGLLGSAMIATGLVLWAVKRRQQAVRKRGRAPFGLLLVEKLNVGTIAGLPIGIAAYFWANRLLPLNVADRANWEAHIMFLLWGVMLVHAICRPTARAWVEQLCLAAVAFSLLPLLNLFTTNRHLGESVSNGDWVFAGFDLTMLAIGLGFAYAAWHAQRKSLAAKAPIFRPRAVRSHPPVQDVPT